MKGQKLVKIHHLKSEVKKYESYYWQRKEYHDHERRSDKMNDILILDDKIYYRVYYYGSIENILDAIVYGAEFVISNGKLYMANLI